MRYLNIMRDVDFTKKTCEEEYWFESAVTMPVISKMFGVNCICYSLETETTNDVTCASIQKDSEPQLIWEGGIIDPTEICSLSDYQKTIALLHVKGNHYMSMTLKGLHMKRVIRVNFKIRNT